MPTILTGTREDFIENNIGLVHACARRFRNKGVEYDDLFQSGCIGLIKAYDGFDPARGVMFSTYAVPIILGEIKKIFRDGGTVKVSRQLKELSLKVARVSQELAKTELCEPTTASIAKKIGCSQEEVIEALCAARPVLSMTSDTEEDRQFEIPVEGREEDIADILSLESAVNELTDDERQLIIMRFYARQTQAQIAKKLGTTQVQISRRERRIIEKLRLKFEHE